MHYNKIVFGNMKIISAESLKNTPELPQGNLKFKLEYKLNIT